MAEIKSDKELKKEFKQIASKSPEKFFPVTAMQKHGFSRMKCSKCGMMFWSATARDVCGDSACVGGFSFIGKKRKDWDFPRVWRQFSELLKKKGYVPIERYPVLARWNPTIDFTIASIAAFQPHVVSGEVEPPERMLTIPQICLRFNDIDNVGITGSHCTGFTMIGQHAFTPADEYNQPQYFEDYLEWYTNPAGLGLGKDEFVIHEDAWAGGGNFGPCLEFFCDGLEIGNQVYMLFEATPDGKKDLKIKVLDMGMGQERCAWFITGKSNLYEASFPTVCEMLFDRTGLKPDHELLGRFMPYAGMLNLDEIDDVEIVWKNIAGKLGVDVQVLKSKILPLAGLYSIAEHSRALLYALADGAIPSNIGGYYNLRVLYRRARNFMEEYGWQRVSMSELAEEHARYLKPMYPELLENIGQVKKILDVEEQKFLANREKSQTIVQSVIQKDIDTQKLIELYDSQGIDPKQIKAAAEKIGKTVVIPDNFYALVSQRHEHEQSTQTKTGLDYDLSGIPTTEILYFGEHDLSEFDAKVLRILDRKFVVLDRSAFYPTSGGQIHDTGWLGDDEVINAVKQGPHILHEMKSIGFGEGQSVHGRIDMQRREQLAIHHSATHLLNGVCKQVLGKHIWQSGAAKTLGKGRLDITHYENLTENEVIKIEEGVNELIKKDLPIRKMLIPRTEAEKKYGRTIYQGGVAPGKILRIVDVSGFDVEACGGTHLSSTGGISRFKILKTSKIQDGLIRIEFAAGPALDKKGESDDSVIQELCELLDCEPKHIPSRSSELFSIWKKNKKAQKKGQTLSAEEKKLQSTQEWQGDIINETARVLNTQPQYVLNTVKKFLGELK
ncbi:alanine--tRNA ligase [Candidatus Woesearchaeota archaeon]|nr:alanine--tRNA ligase [Candidatus Woesearchaeota archaeon]